MSHWSIDSIFYHIYPFGLCGAPPKNDFHSQPVPRLNGLTDWITHINEMGINALYIGPLFESSSHGYDTADYFKLDRRLGTNADLISFVNDCHHKGIRVIFDAVFNHVGRDHFAFKDLQQNGWNSPYRDWFYTNFDKHSSFGDPFWYEGWNGHYSLVKLNLTNTSVKKHIFDALTLWIDTFGVDGLRLDAADCMDKNFFSELRTFCKAKRSDFWLMAEIIHGNYRDWANSQRLDSVTNYECFKGLWSSHNDGNYFEIAYAIDRQFGKNGIYKDLPLYNFVDNHDVDRVASVLKDPAYLYPLHILLFTMPGVPSIYYGSEWEIKGKKANGSDAAIRPALNLTAQQQSLQGKDLYIAIRKFITLRKELPALRTGSYKPLHVGARQYAFLRETDNQTVVVAVNSAKETVIIELKISLPDHTVLIDRLNGDERFEINGGKVRLELFPCWGRVLEKRL
jgi:cyclomaltodextrinase